MKSMFISVSLASSAVLLSACGGGGGGSVGQVSPPADELVEITSANAKTVASGVMLSAFEGGNLGLLAVPDVTAATMATKTTALYAKAGAAQSDRNAGLFKTGDPVYSQAAIGPTTEACDFGGSVTVSGDIASAETLSPGDTLSMVFDACADGVTVTDGGFSMTVAAFSGDVDTGVFSLSVGVELETLSIQEADETVIADGDVTMQIALASPTLELALSSDELTVEADGQTHSLHDYAMNQTVDVNTGDYSLESEGAVTSSEFAGMAQFETVEPFVGLGAEHPYDGELLITGAEGATIRAIALDSTLVRIEVDSDGDGTADSSEDVTWEELTTA